MRNAVIFHGTSATPDANWFSWLKQELEQDGYEVWLPQLPNWSAPSTQIFFKMVAEQNFNFNEETILIGHSSGAVAIMHLLPKLGLPIKAAYLVSPFYTNLGWPALKNLFDRPFNFEAISQKAEQIFILHSDDDPYVALDQAQFISEHTGADLTILPGQGHFNTEKSQQYTEFPVLLAKIRQTAQ